MKLLEVDEAANHIRELVDPNANIIWGSAFNPDLDGKIRVSVVATGIEQSQEQAEIASRPVSIPNTSRGPAVPSAAPAAPVYTPPVAEPAQPAWSPAAEQVQPVAPAAEPEPEPFDLTLDLSEAQEEPDSGELSLGGMEAPVEPAPEAAPAAPEPAMPRLGRAPEAEPAKPSGGSTLFERMANLSRGNRGGDDDGDDDGSALNIPRFLGRQNNQ